MELFVGAMSERARSGRLRRTYLPVEFMRTINDVPEAIKSACTNLGYTYRLKNTWKIIAVKQTPGRNYDRAVAVFKFSRSARNWEISMWGERGDQDLGTDTE